MRTVAVKGECPYWVTLDTMRLLLMRQFYKIEHKNIVSLFKWQMEFPTIFLIAW